MQDFTMMESTNSVQYVTTLVVVVPPNKHALHVACHPIVQ